MLINMSEFDKINMCRDAGVIISLDSNFGRPYYTSLESSWPAMEKLISAVADAAVKDVRGRQEAVVRAENLKGFNQGVVYSAAIISVDCATFASELLSSAGITRAKAIEFECDDHDISCIDEHSAWPNNMGS